ncbi:MAG: sulfite exporter TauE/SafE family protein [Gammaproteobacteria bacterium]|nr:sulfite exporter TauE/SafE family protein [Gammaproteobacteria bacterium]NNF59996.1 sulfite exporter TauE/SafE family protein [Gammaproteobacteria bacterium]NNM20697.1 sulfite exporter TauE/SafE family protein [Gammaproteobacteria bacterium]
MITDPLFYLAAVPAVFLFGIAKGGFGGGLGVAAVPLMALVVSPVQAAGILLPLLCLMDLFGLWVYREHLNVRLQKSLLPGAVLGIAIGTALFGYMSTAMIRIILGVIAITFTLNHWFGLSEWIAHHTRRAGWPAAAGSGMVAGFTSFIAHAGGPPINMYLLTQGMSRTLFVGTTVLFFAVVNYTKLIPYAWLGQLDATNLWTSAVLAPLAPAGIAAGVWLHRRVSDKLFFRIAYVMLFIVGLRLLYDGVSG